MEIRIQQWSYHGRYCLRVTPVSLVVHFHNSYQFKFQGFSLVLTQHSNGWNRLVKGLFKCICKPRLQKVTQIISIITSTYQLCIRHSLGSMTLRVLHYAILANECSTLVMHKGYKSLRVTKTFSSGLH